MTRVEQDRFLPDPRLDLPLWDTTDETERVLLASGIADQFPAFRFKGIEDASQGTQLAMNSICRLCRARVFG